MPFKVGDVVMLKSGGASMTVAEVGTGAVLCAWHRTRPTGGYEHAEQTYAEDMLLPVAEARQRQAERRRRVVHSLPR